MLNMLGDFQYKRKANSENVKKACLDFGNAYAPVVIVYVFMFGYPSRVPCLCV